VSDRPRLAVLAVLAAAGVAFGGYYLWPSGRHIAGCHAPVPRAAQKALAEYRGRIRHDVQRSPTARIESWSDSLTGRMRQLVFERGRLVVAYGDSLENGVKQAVWVHYDRGTWTSQQVGVGTGATNDNGAAVTAQRNRDRVAQGKAEVVGRERIDGRQLLRLRQFVPASAKPGFGHVSPPGYHLDTWVDPLTYISIRDRFTTRGQSSTTDETWLPRNAHNVALTRLAIPAGFKRVSAGGSFLIYADTPDCP
jgi:hypothetical protein